MPIKVKSPKPQVIDAEFRVIETVTTSESSTPPLPQEVVQVTYEPAPSELYEEPQPQNVPATALRACRVCGRDDVKLKKMAVLLWNVDVCYGCIKLGTNAATLLQLILG